MSEEKSFKKVISKMDGAKIWLPELENETIIGKIILIASMKFGTQYVIEDINDKNVKYTTPSHQVLQNLMIDVKKDDIVKIVFLGIAEGKTQDYRNYEVFKAE